MARKSKLAGGSLPQVAYYYPEPYWRLGEIDSLKSLLLFFDKITILLPRYMRGRELAADPVLAGPLTKRGLLERLDPKRFVDKEMTAGLSEVLVELTGNGVFDDLDRRVQYHELSYSRLGWDADVKLAKKVVDALDRHKLARKSEDGVSVPLHPVVRLTVLVLLSQLARAAGQRQGLDLHPVTTDQLAVSGLISTLSLSRMPSAGHVVMLDMETVTLNLEAVPLDEVLAFRQEHGDAYRDYARDLRRTIAQLSPLPPQEREQLLYDRRDELADRAHELRQVARRAWRRPMASAALGAAGAVLPGGGILAGILAAASSLMGGGRAPTSAGVYTYVFEAQRAFSEAKPFR